MALLKDFCAKMNAERVRMGFRSDWEMLVVNHNWREVFGTDLPKGYYHTRDKQILFDGIRYALTLDVIGSIKGELN